jgi:hypothetical protein
MVERNNALRLAIFKHRESSAVEIGDDALLVVDDRSVEHDFVNILAKDEDTALLVV